MQRRLLKALLNDGFSSTVSNLALIIFALMELSLAQEGIKPQVIISKVLFLFLSTVIA